MGDQGRWLKLGDLVINADTIVGVKLDAKWSVVIPKRRRNDPASWSSSEIGPKNSPPMSM